MWLRSSGWGGVGTETGGLREIKNREKTHIPSKEDGPERRTAGLPAVRWHEWLAYPGGGCR